MSRKCACWSKQYQATDKSLKPEQIYGLDVRVILDNSGSMSLSMFGGTVQTQFHSNLAADRVGGLGTEQRGDWSFLSAGLAASFQPTVALPTRSDAPSPYHRRGQYRY